MERNAEQWVDLWAPKKSSDLVGNAVEISRFRTWAQNREHRCRYPCALISGPPGVGKTSTAKIILRECGFRVIEFNASDIRNKALLETTVAPLLRSSTDAENQRPALILDEIDGMDAKKSDKGGLAYLKQILPKTSIPVVCLCNKVPDDFDRLKWVMALKFIKPSDDQIYRRCVQVLGTPKARLDFCKIAHGDMRQALHMHQFWDSSPSSFAPQTLLDTYFPTINDAYTGLFNPTTALDTKCNAARFDDFLMPLMVHSNLLGAFQVHFGSLKNFVRDIGARTKAELRIADATFEALDDMSAADLWQYRFPNETADVQPIVQCVFPTFRALIKNPSSLPWPTFPYKALGNISSSTSKNKKRIMYQRIRQNIASIASYYRDGAYDLERTKLLKSLSNKALLPKICMYLDSSLCFRELGRHYEIDFKALLMDWLNLGLHKTTASEIPMAALSKEWKKLFLPS